MLYCHLLQTCIGKADLIFWEKLFQFLDFLQLLLDDFYLLLRDGSILANLGQDLRCTL